MSTCSARQEGDEMACGRCGLRWGVADADPPPCLQHERRNRPRGPMAEAVVTLRAVAASVPERRQDHETRRRLEVQADGVDYRGLLLKYMRHMLAEDGSTGVNWIGTDGRGYFSDVLFSAEEVAALKVCADELEGAPAGR